MADSVALIDKPQKRIHLEVGQVNVATVFLVGCGGTGSFAALHLARLAYVAKEKGLVINLVFIDPDHVEAKNIGRQNFAPAEIGQPKAVTLARRFSHAFGLAIRPVVEKFDYKLLIKNSPWSNQLSLIVGCVDNPAARRSIAEWGGWDGRTWWLDAGNDQHGGQIFLGNTPFPDRDEEGNPLARIDPLGYCTGLPLPSVQEPGLIGQEDLPAKAVVVKVFAEAKNGKNGRNGKQADPPPPGPSCAELMAAEAQSLMINQAMAGWLATYAYRLLLGHDLDIQATYVDLAGGTVRSVPIAGTPEKLKKVEPVEVESERLPVMDEDQWDAWELIENLQDAAGWGWGLEELVEITDGTCPQCGDGVIEGVDTINDEEMDIVFCRDCQWLMPRETLAALLADMMGQTDDVQTAQAMEGAGQ